MTDKIADFYRALHSLSNDEIVATVNKLESILYARQNSAPLCPECGHLPHTQGKTISGPGWPRCGAHGPNKIGKRGILYRPHRCFCKNKCHKGVK